jgi:hypothetical protein
MRELFVLISEASSTVGTSLYPKPDLQDAKEQLSRKFSHRASISGPEISVCYYGVYCRSMVTALVSREYSYRG